MSKANGKKGTQSGGSATAATGKKLKTQIGQLAENERCIYQAFDALLDYGEEAIAQTAMGTGKIKEIDDEAAAVALADEYKFAGPTVVSGSEFWQLKAADNGGKRFFLIITRSSKVKGSAAFTNRDAAAMKTALSTGSGMEGVTWHAIGVTASQGCWVVHDKQKLWKNGPNADDAVVYWVK